MSIATGILALFGLLVASAVLAGVLFNRLVLLRNRFLNAFSQIDVQLKRRYDLIPNLVETVKGFMSHERDTLEAVTRARNTAAAAAQSASIKPNDAVALGSLMSAEGALVGALSQFRLIAEAYPDLKTNRTTSRLMEELSSTENRVAFARQAYNDAVMQYNTAIGSFPSLLIAAPFSFNAATLFEIQNPNERLAVPVSL